MNDFVVIPYSGQQVSVPKEVADFLEQDRKVLRRVQNGGITGWLLAAMPLRAIASPLRGKRLKKLHEKLKGSVI